MRTLSSVVSALALFGGASAFFRLPCTDPIIRGFPKLYFRDPKTKLFEPVGNRGLLVYYLNRGDADVFYGGPGLKAFPEGFKMINGNPRSRSKKFTTETGTQELRERATKWACLRYSAGLPGYEGHGFPTTDCEAGFQARLHMPSCWDGKACLKLLNILF
ncbi:unnamed protein product [Rhizoctonia solani]|uniref:DUF1996 domain-containing protein n=1 Tax=Rhizoctonia solani TaxID=456999 RepID=A0A8H2XFB1_9AGAM|nr:unnamed protein product [Rhizoctonia solani]